jgi:hypothetical protein
MKKYKQVTIFDASKGAMSFYWNAPLRVLDIIEKTRENWAGIREPPTDFVITKRPFAGTPFSCYDVTYEKAPMTVRSVWKWLRRKVAQWISPS